MQSVKPGIARAVLFNAVFFILPLAFLPHVALGQAASLVMQSPSITDIQGEGANFSVDVGGTPSPTVLWQESADSGVTWTPLTDGGGISGSATATLSIAAVTAAMSGLQFQAVATNTGGSVTSNPVTLTVNAMPAGSTLEYNLTVLAGSSTAGSTDSASGAPLFNNPYGVAVDNLGNAYVADSSNNTIRKISPAGIVTTLAGTAGTSGSTDSAGGSPLFNRPSAIALDNVGNVYVADTGNNTIRKISAAGVVTTLAGTAGTSGSTDSAGGAPLFSNPNGVAVDQIGNVYVGDTTNYSIRKISPAGVVTTLAGPVATNFTNRATCMRLAPTLQRL